MFNQAFGEAGDDSTLVGMSVNRMAGAARVLPLAGYIAGSISIQKISKAQLDGLRIGRLTGRSLGWRVDITISAREAVSSHIGGVNVLEHLKADLV